MGGRGDHEDHEEGAAAGLVGAAASSRVLESLLHGVATDDLVTFAAAPVVLLAVALVACWFPARRATRVNPSRRYDSSRVEGNGWLPYSDHGAPGGHVDLEDEGCGIESHECRESK